MLIGDSFVQNSSTVHTLFVDFDCSPVADKIPIIVDNTVLCIG